MSQEECRKVVSKAVLDEEFRKDLFNAPEKALEGFDLTTDEVQALRSLPAETIDDFANNLEERISMSLVAFSAEAFGSYVRGGDAMGMGGEVGGGEVRGGQAFGGAAFGQDARGGEVRGGEVMGGEVRGGKAFGYD